jgi:hypothetical protein
MSRTKDTLKIVAIENEIVLITEDFQKAKGSGHVNLTHNRVNKLIGLYTELNNHRKLIFTEKIALAGLKKILSRGGYRDKQLNQARHRFKAMAKDNKDIEDLEE